MKNDPRQKDPLRAMSPGQRAGAMKSLLLSLFGEQNGARIYDQMEPVMTTSLRQPGDARDPRKNHWKGVWKIHELE